MRETWAKASAAVSRQTRDYLVEALREKQSWRDTAAETLDDACAIDTSASGIDRTPKSWWMTSIEEPIGYVLTDDETVSLIKAMCRRRDDAIHQAMNNNLWDNHPGEIDRWADDGGASSHAVPSATSEQRKPLENEGFAA